MRVAWESYGMRGQSQLVDVSALKVPDPFDPDSGEMVTQGVSPAAINAELAKLEEKIINLVHQLGLKGES